MCSQIFTYEFILYTFLMEKSMKNTYIMRFMAYIWVIFKQKNNLVQAVFCNESGKKISFVTKRSDFGRENLKVAKCYMKYNTTRRESFIFEI